MLVNAVFTEQWMHSLNVGIKGKRRVLLWEAVGGVFLPGGIILRSKEQSLELRMFSKRHLKLLEE